ncbi:MAG: DUF58 domain-containing protein [Gammaproteobacteria bacterium]|nr:DUF58 domain-containing protein [Gammaproteobacteria bacterium]
MIPAAQTDTRIAADESRRWWSRRFEAWIQARTPRVPSPWVVARGRIYILPTRYGYAYAALLLVMLLGAMNYSNSMAFATTFLLTGLGLVGMHQTHANLINLRIAAAGAEPAFAGGRAQFRLRLDNPTARNRYSLHFSWRGDGENTGVDVPAQGNAAAALELPAARRGWLPAPRLTLATRFPLGLFRAWSWINLDQQALVYPQPAPPGRKPPQTAGSGGRLAHNRGGDEEFAGLRDYRPGDHLGSIHWKSLPKIPRPQVKQFSETQAQSLWLDWDELGGLDVEQRLAQLTRWVLEAEAAGVAYGLRLPDRHIPPAGGVAQRHRCLEALALFGI